ncbi:hypothetical protein QBC32DRAFT_376173 [Pseudoneurospora amorphoporcata]|uniref:Uncharacterized protein n=1 Tax=Pseudoneurospora amorphoporcata TaxID=241081 RepID=A0AAN6NSX8_9PEZI|nr:hypothetical protein QBC32DRAFT_376173 [Pseudoneurospora amorphoporcata]
MTDTRKLWSILVLHPGITSASRPTLSHDSNIRCNHQDARSTLKKLRTSPGSADIMTLVIRGSHATIHGHTRRGEPSGKRRYPSNVAHTAGSSHPRNIISTIHNAAKRRHSVAMEFLQHSTAERKRAVFLEGGTRDAKLMCLDAIGKAYTAGNLEKAAAIFDRLMSQGLRSLEDDEFDVGSIIDPKSSDPWAGNPDVNKDVWANMGNEANRGEDDDKMEDPITKAMRAADALDRETENLQPPNHDVDLSVPLDFGLIRPRARSLSMSAVENMVAAPDGMIREREVDFDTSAAANTNAFQLLPSPLLFPSNPARTTTTTSFLAISPPKKTTQGQLRKARSYEPPQNLRATQFNLRVDDFDNAQMTSMASPKASAQHWNAREEFAGGAGIGVATTMLGSGTGTENKDREWDGTASLSNYSTATPTTHDATHVGARGHATAVSPKPPRFHVPLRNLFEKKPRAVERLNLDDDDGVIGTEGQRTPSDETAKSFEPLLPFNEHYVIHFSNGKPDDQFSFVSSRYKDCFDANHRPSTSTDSPKTDATAVSPHNTKELKDNMTSIEHNMYTASEYDPYRYEAQPKPEPQSTTPTPGYVFPASFPITPSLSASRFHDLSTHNKTAVWVQNTLRSVLDNHTPVEEIDYLSSASDSPDPQLRSLWEPLMCAEMDQQKEAERKVDLILAIGAEGGVKKDFKQAVMAKVEQLGFPSNGDGMSRSGRLGLRYLIGNAMQTFTSQPLTQQSKENPFSNPTLLASLIIPHIDTYLRGNDNVRFLLIEYPVEHLSTMLAMQKLMGSQVMKVVGIANEADTTIFSMADYRLSATAPEAEISECVGAIRDALASVSDFYKPQSSGVPVSTDNDAVPEERGATAKALSTKSSNLTNTSIAPLLPPQHSPRHRPSSAVIPAFTAMSTPPPPLLPVSPTDTYNHTHTYVHSNGQNHSNGHFNTYMPPTATIHLPTTTRSISPPPCSHCSSTLSTSITRSNTLISHGTVPVATPTVIPPQSPHSIARERSQRPSISGSGAATTTNRLQSPLSRTSGASTTSSLLSTGDDGTDFNTDDSEANGDDTDNMESDDDPFDFFEIDFEERRLMPMFLKSQLEAHVAQAAGATTTTAASVLGSVMGHRSPAGNREVVDLDALLGGGRKDFGERFHASGQGLVCPLPPKTNEVIGGQGRGRGTGDVERELKTNNGGVREKGRGGMGKKDKKGSKKTKSRNSAESETATTAAPAPAVVGLGAMAAALEADGGHQKANKNLKKRKNATKTKTKTNTNAANAPNRPLSPCNTNQPDPGNGGGNNNYTRPSSRKTTTTIKDQQVSQSTGGGVVGMAGGVAVAGGEQRKALRWLGIA